MYGNHAVHNILVNLAEMESEYVRNTPDFHSMDMLDSYREYFAHEYIRSNRLMNAYWPQVNIPEHNVSTKIGMVDEASAIANHLNIAILKKFAYSSLHPHATTFFEMQYIYRGKVTLHWNGQVFELIEGDCFVTMPGVPFYFDHCPDGILIHIMARRSFISDNYMRLFQNDPIALAFFSSVCSDPTTPEYLLIHASDNAYLNETLLTLFDEYLNHNEYSSDVLENLFALFCSYLKKYSDGEPDCSVSIDPMEKPYQAITRFLQTHYPTARLDDLASHLHFSKQYICKIIRSRSGKSFSELVKEYRIAAAKDYLENTALSLEVISELTGFSDGAHLSRVFKQATGLSPSSFRKEKNNYNRFTRRESGIDKNEGRA